MGSLSKWPNWKFPSVQTTKSNLTILEKKTAINKPTKKYPPPEKSGRARNC